MSRRLKKRKAMVQQTKINRSWIVLIVIAALVIAAVLFIKIRSGYYTLGLHPTRTPVVLTATPMSEVLPSEVSPAEASQMQAIGALILDVREQDEWDAGHVEGAN
jgi:hypothetical protein